MAATTLMKATRMKTGRTNPGVHERPARERVASARPSARLAQERTPQERIPRMIRQKVEALLEENYAFMDSPVFKQRNIEKELFSFDEGMEPQLPMTAWYQPTRDDALDSAIVGAPQLMKAAEERLMFQRFNFAKRKLT